MLAGSHGARLQFALALSSLCSCAGFHATAAYYGLEFFNALASSLNYSRPRRRRRGVVTSPEHSVLEVGSRNVNGGMRRFAPAGLKYVGVDVEEGPGVDFVLEDPYRLPFPDQTFIATVSSSAFEHVDFFWLSFLEILRVTRPDGFVYLNAPSDQPDHSHEVPPDSWRFLADAGGSLERWGRRSGYPSLRLLQSFVSGKNSYQHHHDCIMIFALGQQGGGAFKDPVIREALPETYEELWGRLLYADPCWRDLPREEREHTMEITVPGTELGQNLPYPAFCCVVTRMFLSFTREEADYLGSQNSDMVQALWLGCWRGGRTFQNCCLH